MRGAAVRNSVVKKALEMAVHRFECGEQALAALRG